MAQSEAGPAGFLPSDGESAAVKHQRQLTPAELHNEHESNTYNSRRQGCF